MSRTLLQIIQAVQGELGLTVATSVINNPDTTTMQMLALAQAEVDELRRYKEGGWTQLQREYNLIVSPPLITTGNVTANSAVITNIPSTTGLVAQYFVVSGAGIPIAARILSVDSPTQITMTMECTGAATATPLTFSQDTYPEPSDFEFFQSKTWYDRTNRWQLIGPDSPQQDQFVRSGIVALGPRRHFRQLGFLQNTYRLWPPPSEIVAPLQLVFEYVSNYVIYVAGANTGIAANYSSYWQTDTDVPMLDDRAIIMGIKWRYWAQKGFNYATLRADYQEYIARQASRDGGNNLLSMVPQMAPFLVNSYNAQDSNFPGPSGTNTT